MSLRGCTTLVMIAAVPCLAGACVSTTLEVPEGHPASQRYAAAPVPSISAFAGAPAASAAPAQDHSLHHHEHHHQHQQGAKP